MDSKILLYKKSIKSYLESLSIRFNKKNHKNLEFVEYKLSLIQKKQKEQANEKNQNNQLNNGKWKLELEIIENFKQKAIELEEEQLENKKLLNKDYEEIFNPFDTFNNIFDNKILDKWEKKDW